MKDTPPPIHQHCTRPRRRTTTTSPASRATVSLAW
jgi:hypothetical protein